MRGIHRSPVNSRHKGPVTRKMFPFDDVIMAVVNSMLRVQLLSLSKKSWVIDFLHKCREYFFSDQEEDLCVFSVRNSDMTMEWEMRNCTGESGNTACEKGWPCIPWALLLTRSYRLPFIFITIYGVVCVQLAHFTMGD